MNTRAESERRVFQAFASQAGLDVDLASIESVAPPAPDIRCRLHATGPVAFELVAIMNEELEKRIGESGGVRREFRDAYMQLPDATRITIERVVGGPPAVFAAVPAGTPPGRWRRAIPVIIDWMRHDTRFHAGDIPVWTVPILEPVLLMCA
jgi:hypothetical protein